MLRRSGDGDEVTLTAKFESLRPKQLDRLKRTLRIHMSGPAQYQHAVTDEPAPATPISAANASSARNGGSAADASSARNGGSATAASSAANGGAAAPPSTTETAGGADRRSNPRHSMDRRVIALGEEANRVLMGRDISIGGMRVNPNPLLIVGQNVRLAIHVGDREIPLVVTARVHRDDGERGIVLRFHGLEPEAARTLNQMLEILPVIEPGAKAESGMIVSEILAEAQ